jgi:hypothetical protein
MHSSPARRASSDIDVPRHGRPSGIAAIIGNRPFAAGYYPSVGVDIRPSFPAFSRFAGRQKSK